MLDTERQPDCLPEELPPRATPPLRTLLVEADPAHGARSYLHAGALHQPGSVLLVDERVRHDDDAVALPLAEDLDRLVDDLLGSEVLAGLSLPDSATVGYDPSVLRTGQTNLAVFTEFPHVVQCEFDLPLDDEKWQNTTLDQLIADTKRLLRKAHVTRVRLLLPQREGGNQHSYNSCHATPFVWTTVALFIP